MFTWLKRRAGGEKGFTLIELLVVVLIIGLLVAIAIPSYVALRNRAYDSRAKSNLRNAVTAAQTYYTDHNGSYANMDAAALGAIESTLTFKDSGAAAEEILVSGVTASTYTLTCTSLSGTAFTATASGSRITYNF